MPEDVQKLAEKRSELRRTGKFEEADKVRQEIESKGLVYVTCRIRRKSTRLRMLKAVIFDLNGTILSDEDEYALSFRNVLKSLGVKVENNFSHTKGIGLKANWDTLK